MINETQYNIATTLKSYTSILCSNAAGFSGPELISDSQKDSENMCCTQMSPHFHLFLGKNGFRVLSPKDERDHPDFHQRQKQKQTSVMVWGCSRANSMGDWLAYVQRCYWHGGIYWNCTKKYTAIKTSFMGSPWLLDQDNAAFILHVLQQCGFVETEWMR